MDNEGGRNIEESGRKKVKMIRTCHEKRRILCGNEVLGKRTKERHKRRWLDTVDSIKHDLTEK